MDKCRYPLPAPLYPLAWLFYYCALLSFQDHANTIGKAHQETDEKSFQLSFSLSIKSFSYGQYIIRNINLQLI